MANTNSNLIGNLDADPRVLNDVSVLGARKRLAVDAFEVTAANTDAIGDTIKLARLPGNAKVTSIKVFSDDLDSGTDHAWDCGIYKIDGTVVDQDAFADADDFGQAADKAGTDLRLDAAGATINTLIQPLWQIAGAASESAGEPQYDIVLTQTATTSGAQAGTAAFIIEYVVD